MKLAIRLENFKGVFARKCVASDDLSFASVEIDRNYSLTLPGNVCVTGVHVTSHNQGLSSNDQARQGRETLGTRLTGVNVVLRAHVYFGQHQDMELWHNHFQNYDD